MIFIILVLIMCNVGFAEGKTEVTSVYHVNAHCVLKTGNRECVAEKINQIAENNGGWLILQKSDVINLRIPVEFVNDFLETIDSMGIITDKVYNRTDCTAQYLNIIAQIQSKQSLLNQYLAVLDSSGTEGIYPVSRSIADLQQGLEELEGSMKGMLERMRYANVKICFRFFDRRQPLATGKSNFEWLNSVNLHSLLEDFR